MSGFEFKVVPFDHQRKIFEERRYLEGDALFLEQGTGKSKVCLDQIAAHYLDGLIDAALILAPNSVKLNWVTDEVPAHLHEGVAAKTEVFCWSSQKASTNAHQRALEALLTYPGLSILVMNYEGFMSSKGKAFAKRFLTKRKVFYVLDESRRIKTPGAKRTKTILASAQYAAYRRILTGTPYSQGPFDIYAPIKFIWPDFWKRNGLGDFYAFKTFFGIFEKGFNGQTGKEYDSLVGYQNLDTLHRLMQKISVRVLKEDVFDLPPKLYSTRYYEPTKEQRRMYSDLVDDFLAILSDGREVAAPLAIVRLLRLQQVLCGYAATNKLDGDILSPEMELVDLKEGNPRLDLLREICEDTPHKAIIWARFKRDIDKIAEMLGDRAVTYDGRVKDAQRIENKKAFQEGDAQFFVANPAAAGEGLTLHAAKTVIYYNNTFKLDERLQSEDRVHRAGLKHAVQYIDLVAPDTIDVEVLNALKQKIDVSSVITGDRLREWVV